MTEDCLKSLCIKWRDYLRLNNITIFIYGSSDKVSPKLTISNSQCFTKTKQKRPFVTEARSVGPERQTRRPSHNNAEVGHAHCAELRPFSFSDPRQKWGGRHARYRSISPQTGRRRVRTAPKQYCNKSPSYSSPDKKKQQYRGSFTNASDAKRGCLHSWWGAPPPASGSGCRLETSWRPDPAPASESARTRSRGSQRSSGYPSRSELPCTHTHTQYVTQCNPS